MKSKGLIKDLKWIANVLDIVLLICGHLFNKSLIWKSRFDRMLPSSELTVFLRIDLFALYIF